MAKILSKERVIEYTVEFKQKVVELTDKLDVNAVEIADALGLHPMMVYRWRQEYREGRFVAKPTRRIDRYWYGNRPNGTYIPRFRNLEGQEKDTNFVRGYGFQAHAVRMDWKNTFNKKGFGGELKESLRKPGPWGWATVGFGEVLPQHSNRMSLHAQKVDRSSACSRLVRSGGERDCRPVQCLG